MVPPVISLMNHRSITWISIQSTMEYGAAYRGPHESRVAGSEYRFRPFPSLAPRHFRMPQGAYVHTCLIHALRAKGGRKKGFDGQLMFQSILWRRRVGSGSCACGTNDR